MLIETKRLVIRDLKAEDELPFVEMAADGSLNDIGFDKDCSQWISEWIAEARELAIKNNPRLEYLAYVVELKDENVVIGSVGCSFYEDIQEIGITYFIGAQYRDNGYALEAVKAYTEFFFSHYDVSRIIATIREENTASQGVVEKGGFQLMDKKMYKDLNDQKAEMYCFYEFRR